MSPRVLVVDDDEAVAETARDIIESIGLEMEWAKSQKEAEELVAKNQYDCILLDRMIPVRASRLARIEHGDTLFTRFMANPRVASTPIIIITGHDVDDPDRAVDMVNAGAFDYVTKPFKTKGKTLASVIMRGLEEGARQTGGSRVPPCPLLMGGAAQQARQAKEGVQASTGTSPDASSRMRLGPKPPTRCEEKTYTYLLAHGHRDNVSCREIAAQIGYSRSRITQTKAWKAYQKRRRQEAEERRRRLEGHQGMDDRFPDEQ